MITLQRVWADHFIASEKPDCKCIYITLPSAGIPYIFRIGRIPAELSGNRCSTIIKIIVTFC